MSEIQPEYIDYMQKYLQRFLPLNQDEVVALAGYCEFREFKKKETILEAGETDQYLNMVLKGLVRKYILTGKRDITLQLATEGHVIHSEISFLTHTPSFVYLEALEPVLLCSLTYCNMELALDKHPQGERLGRLIVQNMYVKKDEKRYKQLSNTTREIFIEYINNHPHMVQRVPQKYLASYLNIKPETFSRLKHLTRMRK